MTVEVPRCGLCVMRNGYDTMSIASCTPRGERRRDDAPCSFYFTKDQLRAPLYGKPLTDGQRFEAGIDLF